MVFYLYSTPRVTGNELVNLSSTNLVRILDFPTLDSPNINNFTLGIKLFYLESVIFIIIIKIRLNNKKIFITI